MCPRNLRIDFDDRVANFVAQLLVNGTSMVGATAFLNDPANKNLVKRNPDGSYEFWPYGVQP